MSTTESSPTLPGQTYSSMKERFATQWYSLPRWARITIVVGVIWAIWKWLNPWELIYLFLLIVGIGGSLVFGVFYVVFEFLGCGEDAVKLFSQFMEDLKTKVAQNAEAAASAAVNAVAAEQNTQTTTVEQPQPTSQPEPQPNSQPQPEAPTETDNQEG